MANEITYTTSLSFFKGNMDSALTATHASKSITVNGTRAIKNIQQIGTTAEAIGLAELASLGLMWVKNMDATNYVELLTGTGGVSFAKLKPGEAILFRVGSGITAPYALANTAAVSILYIIIED